MAKKKQAELSIAEQAAAAEANAATQIENSTATEAPTEAPKAAEPAKPKAPGKIAQILEHFKAGKTNKEISELFVLDAEGKPTTETFHPTTISIQVSKYKLAHPDLYPPKAPALTKAQKKELAAKEKAEKEAAEKATAEAEIPAEANA